MATLIKTTTDLKQYVSTAFNFTYTNIEPYVKRAEREFIKTIIGDTLYENWTETVPETNPSKRIYELMMEASANLAVFLYVPVGSVNIADGGIMTISNANATPAQWWQVRDLQRTLSNLGFSAIDEALKLLEASENAFPDWVDTEGYTVFKELITPKTQDFQRHFNISNSRRTFIALRPHLLETQRQVFNWIDSDTLDQIKTGTTSEEKEARDLIQAAQVNFAVVKAVQTGMFDFSATGLFVRSLELPGEKAKEIESNQLLSFCKSRGNAAEEHLKLLKAHLLKYPEVFTDFTEDDTEVTVNVHNTKSIVTF